jgi:hypothetical protein
LVELGYTRGVPVSLVGAGVCIGDNVGGTDVTVSATDGVDVSTRTVTVGTTIVTGAFFYEASSVFQPMYLGREAQAVELNHH